MLGASAPNDLLFFMAYLLKVERYSHGIRISEYSRDVFYKIKPLLERLSLREPRKLPGNKVIMEVKKKYFGMFSDEKEIYLHINSLEDLIGHLENKGISRNQIQIIDIPVPEASPAVYEIYEKYVIRDYQEIIKEDTIRPEMVSVRVDLQTGRGKTLTTLASLACCGVRSVVMVPPKYFGIWDKALKETYKNIHDRYITISGSAELQKLIDRGIDDDLDGIDIIIISSTTYRAYIDNFEQHGSQLHKLGYNVPPPRFHEVIKAGWQINDEIQEDPGLVFRIDIFSNVSKQVYLSATPFTGNAFVTKMIDVMLPEHTKCRLPSYDVYINCMGLLYSEPSIKSKDYLTPYKNTYNHARYETVMLQNKKRLDSYFKMTERIVEGVYLKDRLHGQKLLLLCATVAFIDKLAARLKSKYPDMVINGHVSGCDYNQLMTNDITVSTIKSSGTGVDIPNLREVVLMHATDSKKDNIQILGRLRKLRDFEDVVPRLTYLICETIPHHMRYAKNKQEHFAGKTLSMVLRRIAM